MGQFAPLDKAFALLVEDDPVQREIMAELLEDEDLHLLSCGTAECAAATMRAAGAQVRLLIVDARLPGVMDGLQLCRIVRRAWPATRVVLVSGWPPAGDMPPGVRFVPKPWLPDDLAGEVRLALSVP